MVTIWFDDSDNDTQQPPAATSPHEARFIADLIAARAVDRVKELCAMLNTDPQAETAAMFGQGVAFYWLSCRSARALIASLESRVRQRAA
jgi:hypothetical protein